MGLSLRIRAARRHANFSQIKLAQQLGISRSAVANWECANPGNPATSRLEKMALVLGVSYEWLATGRGSMTYEHALEEAAIEARLTQDDPMERRLLDAFRDAPDKARLLILEMAEFHRPSTRVGNDANGNSGLGNSLLRRWR